MKTYKGTKIVNALPMNRLDYNVFRGWELPADEDGTDEGYLVEYTDGGKANTTQYKGYISWSPKDVFERAYFPMETLSIHERVRREYQQLSTRLGKLRQFIETNPEFSKLSDEARFLLGQQLLNMHEYSTTLQMRLQLLEKEPA